MEYSNIRSEIIYSDNPEKDLSPVLQMYTPGKIFLVTETNVFNLWFKDQNFFAEFPRLVLPSGEENKKIENVAKVWEFLSKNGADRKSLIINVGGGMLTDLCGFAASTFKRGIDFVNIPTTLLSQVDASVGGKTGINFGGLKNEIGTFSNPRAVIICTQFLKTLDTKNMISGFAEMIKHGLIFSPDHLSELKHFDPANPDYLALQDYIRHSVEVKEHFVLHDPKEKNIRKALNFGHTTGHALESFAMEQNHPVLHGYAVAWGMISELYLSCKVCGFPQDLLNELSAWIIGLYGNFTFRESDYEPLFELMKHDKKNESGRINFTLLENTGRFVINQNCDREQVFLSLDFLRKLAG
jgi:3-dehydroquinate synthase